MDSEGRQVQAANRRRIEGRILIAAGGWGARDIYRTA